MTATKETLEDYTLRFAPRSYRKWSTAVVGISALGGIAYLADFAIGASIGISYGTTNALWGILIFAVVVMLTGFPVAYYSARYNIDLDLVTRGSGFGYYGSVVTNVIFATFTFIFFALEGSIMAQGLQLGLGIPLWIGYAASTLIIFPLVIYGMKVLSTLQVWTTPLWLILMVAPFVYLVVSHPESVNAFFAYGGTAPDGTPLDGSFNMGNILLAAGVCLSLIAQIAEQNDYLRFMPPKTPENKRSWWTWMFLAGPGWVIFGAIKQIVGLFLAVYLIGLTAEQPGHRQPAGAPVPGDLPELPAGLAGHDPRRGARRDQPDQDQRDERVLGLAGLDQLVHPSHQDLPRSPVVPRLQPVDRADPDGSRHVQLPEQDPGLLRQLRYGVGRGRRLGHRVQQVPAEAVTKGAGVPPRHAVQLQPGGLRVDADRRRRVDHRVLRWARLRRSRRTRHWSPSVWHWYFPRSSRVATKGKYYLRRTDDGIDLPMFDEHGNPADDHLKCDVCHHDYERPDMLKSASTDGYICSLCLSTDKTGEHVLPAQK